MNYTIANSLIKNSYIITRMQNVVNISLNAMSVISRKKIHTTNINHDLMEFFDVKKNWSETEIKVGRAWKLDELRIKSNTDLHKLWYVLLKERNMLFTMENECNMKMRLFPNPERIDKVEESMKNIETVVRERNVAYYQLETGETGERSVEDVINMVGLPMKYEKKEYDIPKFMNTRWVKPYLDYGIVNSLAVKKFIRLYKEKQRNEERKARNRDYNHVQQLLKRFPNMDLEKLKMEYPNVDIEKAKRTRKARGHFMPLY